MSSTPPDPDFAAAASELRALFPGPADVERQLSAALAHARAAADPTVAAFATALVEVIGVTHKWNLQSDYAQTIGCREAASAIMDAIQRGLTGGS
jgi:hypothetical protein